MKSSLMRTRWAAIGAAVVVALGGGTLLVANAASDGATFRAITPCRLLDTRPTQVDTIVPRGIRRGKIGPTTENNITVIFDPTAKFDPVVTGENFSYQTGDMANDRAILGACRDLVGTEIDPTHVVKSVLLNVTTTNSSTSSFLTIYPWIADVSAKPLASVLNPSASAVQVNSVTVALNQISGASAVTIPGVTCSDNLDRGASDCRGLTAFRVYNHLGSTDVVIDVMGYYYGGP